LRNRKKKLEELEQHKAELLEQDVMDCFAKVGDLLTDLIEAGEKLHDLEELISEKCRNASPEFQSKLIHELSDSNLNDLFEKAKYLLNSFSLGVPDIMGSVLQHAQKISNQVINLLKDNRR
jgi:hypothetical protein